MGTYDYDKGSKQFCVTKRNLVYNYYFAEPTNGVAKQTVLLLHGNGDYSYGWRYTIPALLAHNIRCIVPDLLGFGESSKPVSVGMYRLKAMAEDIMEVMSHAGVADHEKFVVVGHDWGSQLASRIMLHYPTRLLACVSITGTYIPPLPDKITLDQFVQQHPNFAYWKFFTDDATPSLMREKLSVFWNAVVRGGTEPSVPMSDLEGRLSADHVPLDWLRKPQIWDDADNEKYLFTYWRGGWEAPMNWYRAFLDNYEDEKVLDPLSVIQTPFLTVLAKYDPAVPTEAAEVSSALLARSSTRILPSGHWVPQEVGSELGLMIVEWLGEAEV